MGLFLQVFLLGHGGYTTLGVNCVIMSVPALLARPGYLILRRYTRSFPAGFIVGTLAVWLTALLNAMVLLFCGVSDWRAVVTVVLFAHLGLGPIEGIIVGFATSYIERVKPEIIMRKKPEQVDIEWE